MKDKELRRAYNHLLEVLAMKGHFGVILPRDRKDETIGQIILPKGERANGRIPSLDS